MAKADLHIHTTASDGHMPPEQVISEAVRLKLSAISITDHDTLKGFKQAQKVVSNDDLELVPGIEITSNFNERECHLLAYDFDPFDKELNQLLSLNKRARIKRAEWIIGQLRKEGLELDIDEALAESNGPNVGRPHIAEILCKKGYIGSVREAFIRYLSDEALGNIKNDYLDFTDIIQIVKAAGGVIVLAHPGRLYTQSECRQFVDGGIDGIEVIHRSHNYKIQKDMESFAATHNLLTSGGSDFHGSYKDYYRHFGLLTISLQWVAKISDLAAHRKSVSV